MFCSDAPAPLYLILSDSVPQLLYYSHIPASLISLLVGFFVYFKKRDSLETKLLLVIALLFSLRSFLNLILWTNIDSDIITFVWSLMGLLDSLLFISCVYFTYTFLNKNDVGLIIKSVWGALLIPVILFSSNSINFFDLTNCEANSNTLYTNYIFILGILSFIWILVISIIKYKKSDPAYRKQVVFLASGVSLFLFSFFTTTFIAGYLGNFQLEQYGLFGMTIFMGFLAYLIVKFHVFNIKLIATQALVTALVILVGSELFFAESGTNQILILITLALSLGFGYMLIKSVKLEVQRKEELQLMSNKLAQSNDKLRAMDNTKSEFISIASHQLRTPLTAIKGFISLLLEGSYGKLKTEQEEALNKTYTSAERLINLVEDLLNISRMESGRMEFKFAPAKMENLCQEIIDTFVLRAKEKDLYLDYKKPETALPELMIDAGKVKEVISNTVDNALKYTPKGGVTLHLEQVAGAVRVIVSDTGIGIPETELPYLFNKFSRGKDVGRLNTGGTGLGLYVGKGMIENNGGRIWAESDGEGKGSRFIIELPVKQSAELLERWG